MKCLTVFLVLTLVCATAVFASSWPHDPKGNLPVAIDPGANEAYELIAADGFGGAIIVWAVDAEMVFAQRIDAQGNFMWPGPGTLVCAFSGYRYPRSVVSDGDGGAIIVWADQRVVGTQHVYAQRVDADGVPLWTANGVRACASDSTQGYITAVQDVDGGVVIAWSDGRYGPNDFDIYAQRMDAFGTPLWAPDGYPACAALGNQEQPMIALTADSMIAVVWEDKRDETLIDVYAAKLDRDGISLWTPNGVALANQFGISESSPGVAADDYGGAFFVWWDWRGGGDAGIYGQRINEYGNEEWTSGGIQLTSASGHQAFPAVIADGEGGIVLSCWDDRHSGTGIDVSLQRVDPSGALVWGSDGVLVVEAPNSQTTYELESDGNGGAVVAWRDDRFSADSDIYAQHVDASGASTWTTNGVAVCTNPAYQPGAATCSDGAGGIIAVWWDNRSVVSGDIYAQRVERNGYLGYPSPDMIDVVDTPLDQGGVVTASWVASWLDAFPYTEITEYTVWRWAEPVGVSRRRTVGSAGVQRALAAGIDRGLVERQAAMGWEYISTTPAANQFEYACSVPTFGDSTSAGVPMVIVKTIAHGTDPWRLWESLPFGGYSKDNLAPAPPLALAAQRVGNHVRLDWTPSGHNEPDFANYAVYRATASGVTPEPIYFIDASQDTTLWDKNAPGGTPYYYIVTSVDYHENQSVPSNEANVDGSVTGIENDAPALTALTVRANVPNPFNTTTELRIGLPEAAEVTISIYDVAGRRVRERHVPLGKGWQSVTVDGRSLPSGVYFYRVATASQVVTRKLVVHH